jgi:GNAT superfamily N-acetyltransferase
MTANLKISRADIGQTDTLVALMESAYRGDDSLKGWTSEAHLIDGQRITHEEMRKTILDPETYLLVAIDETKDMIIGCAAVSKEDEGTCSFGKFAVSPTLQGGGTGKLLLNAGEDIARAYFGASRMVMTVIDGRTELEAYYERRGYTRTGAFVRMADIFHGEVGTRGMDLVLNEFAKPL